MISALMQDASLPELAFGRRVISEGIASFTVPGMWLLLITGGLAALRRGAARFIRAKTVIMAAILVNAYFFVIPAADTATEFAEQALASGVLSSEYGAAYLRESLFGAANVLGAVVASVLGVWAGERRSSKDHMGR
jgi:hypothetical protein